jgi:hypothetical protein
MGEDQITYKSRMQYFTECYDTMNPLTAKEGRLRLLRAELERAKSSGGASEDVIRQLKERE